MCKVFGVSHSTPEQMLLWMLKKKVIQDASEVAVVPNLTKLKKRKPVHDFLFIPAIASLRSNLDLFNAYNYTDVSIFVFASPVAILEISPVTPLDFVQSDLSPVVFTPVPLSLPKMRLTKSAEVSIHKVDFLKRLTDSVKVGSLLNPLMTFIYTLPSSTHQTPVKEAVAQYLYLGLSKAKLSQMFDACASSVSTRIRLRIDDILSSDVGQSYFEAFKTLHREGLDAACQQHTVNSYEMRYLISIAESKK